MSDAVVEERPQVSTRFYCHMCNVEITIPNADFTCPLCSGGFVEELPALPPTAAISSGASTSTGRTGRSNSLGGNGGHINQLDHIRGEIASLLMARTVPNFEIQINANGTTNSGSSVGSGSSNTNQRNNASNLVTIGSIGNSGGNGSGGTAGGRVRQGHFDRFENILIDFLQSLSGNTDGDAPMLYLGNLGDYAWGREGIDTIVTQLLNQMETSGPPPLSKDRIQNIPKFEITDDEVSKKLQCSVCWEDFQLQEIVRKLPCTHLYHENCIVPWLELHGTCPICRKSLTSEENATAGDGGGGGNSAGNSGSDNNSGSIADNDDNAMQTDDTPLHANTNTGASSSGSNNLNITGHIGAMNQQQQTTSTSQAASQRNVFGFDDGNVDLD